MASARRDRRFRPRRVARSEAMDSDRSVAYLQRRVAAVRHGGRRVGDVTIRIFFVAAGSF